MGGNISCPRRNNDKHDVGNQLKSHVIKFPDGSQYEGSVFFDNKNKVFLPNGHGVYRFSDKADAESIEADFIQGEIDYTKVLEIRYKNGSIYHGKTHVVGGKIEHHGDGCYQNQDKQGNFEKQEGFFVRDKLRIGIFTTKQGDEISQYVGFFNPAGPGLELITGYMSVSSHDKRYYTEIKDGVVVEPPSNAKVQISDKGKTRNIQELSPEQLQEKERIALRFAKELLEQEDKERRSNKKHADNQRKQQQERKLQQGDNQVKRNIVQSKDLCINHQFLYKFFLNFINFFLE